MYCQCCWQVEKYRELLVMFSNMKIIATITAVGLFIENILCVFVCAWVYLRVSNAHDRSPQKSEGGVLDCVNWRNRWLWVTMSVLGTETWSFATGILTLTPESSLQLHRQGLSLLTLEVPRNLSAIWDSYCYKLLACILIYVYLYVYYH